MRQVKLALRVLEWLPFPWRFSRASLDARQDFLRHLEDSSFPRAGDLLLFLKVLAGLGYGNDPRVQRAIGYEMRCEVAGERTRLRFRFGPWRAEPARRRRGVRRGNRGLGCRWCGDCSDSRRGRARGRCAGSRPVHGSAHLSRRAARCARRALPRWRPDDRRGTPGDPNARRPGRRRDDRDQLGNLLPCAGAGARRLGRRARDRVGRRSDPRVRSGGGDAPRAHRRPGADGPKRPALARGRRGPGSPPRALAAQRRRLLLCSSCPAGCRLDAKQAMHVSYLPRAVAAGARVRAQVEARRVVFERGQATGIDCVAHANGRARPFKLRARRAVVLAGGAFGTPELLLRSGFRSPSGQLGRNLRIHPACWVGARFAEEVRGWEGVMQSYAVNEWEDRGVLLEATFTPLAFGAQWLPGTGVEHSERVLAYDRIASTGVHLSDRSAGRVGLARDGSLRITYRLTEDDASRLDFRDRPRGRALVRCRRPGGLSADRRHSDHPEGPNRRPRGLAAGCRRAAPGGVSPHGYGANGRRPPGGRRRHRRCRPRSRCPVRGRWQPAAELDRRQPDDDHHRDGSRSAASSPIASPARRPARLRRRIGPNGARPIRAAPCHVIATAARRRPSRSTSPPGTRASRSCSLLSPARRRGRRRRGRSGRWRCGARTLVRPAEAIRLLTE